jgi:hypothetical protein
MKMIIFVKCIFLTHRYSNDLPDCASACGHVFALLVGMRSSNKPTKQNKIRVIIRSGHAPSLDPCLSKSTVPTDGDRVSWTPLVGRAL